MAFKKNTAVTGFTVGLVSATDGSDITTGTPVGYYTLDGGVQTAIGDITPVHEGNGLWSFDLTAGEMNGDVVGLTFTHASAITAHFTVKTVTELVSDLNDIVGPTVSEFNARTLLAASYFDPAADTVATVTSVTNQVTADVTAISGDSVAADNLEATYDGTGYADDAAPATQEQIGRLSTGSAAISTSATGAVVTVGTETLTYTSTANLDSVYHEIADVAGQIDFKYQFDVGGNGVGTSATLKGRMTGNGDDIPIYAYNWGTTNWDQVALFSGSNSTTDIEGTLNLLAAHTGTGANLGKVEIRAYQPSGLTSAVMYMDQIYISYSIVAQSVGYAQGRIWIDTVHGVAGTESYVNGVADNPVLTLADALTLGTALKIHDFNISSESTITPAAALNDSNMYGIGYTLALNNQDYAGTHFFHSGNVTGTATSGNNSDHLDIVDSIIGDVTVDDAHFTNCGVTGTITLAGVGTGTPGELKLIKCFSLVAGSSTPCVDFGTGTENHNVTVADWQNGIEIKNFNTTTTGGTDLLSLSGTGQLVINASCDGGTVNLRGQWKVTDNSGGAVTIVRDDNSTTLSTLNDISVSDILTTQMTESYATDGTAPTLAQALMLIQQSLGDFAISGTTITVKKVDGATTAATFTLDDGTNPTSTTRAS